MSNMNHERVLSVHHWNDTLFSFKCTRDPGLRSAAVMVTDAEGRVIDGCVTCPWHGYQYLPDCGASPPPFEERVPTFRVRLQDGGVWINPRPLSPGTRVEPALLSEETA